MSTYKTKNPLGSAAVKDLYDNAENLDKFVNDRTKEESDDRLGVLRKTWYGMEMIFNRFIAYITGRGEQAIATIGWQELGDWAIGLTVDNRQQIVYYNGSWYKYLGDLEHVIAGDSPGNDGGIWSKDNPTGKWSNIGDAALRSNLGSDEGAGLVSHKKPYRGAVRRRVADQLSETISPWDFNCKPDAVFDPVTKSLIDGTDNTSNLQRMMCEAHHHGVDIYIPLSGKFASRSLYMHYDPIKNPDWTDRPGRLTIRGGVLGHATGDVENQGSAIFHIPGESSPLMSMIGEFSISNPAAMGGYFELSGMNLIGSQDSSDVLLLQGSQGQMLLQRYGVKVLNPAGNGITEATTWETMHILGLIRGPAIGDGSCTGIGLNIKSDGTIGQINMKQYLLVNVMKMGYGIRAGRREKTNGTLGPLVFTGGQTSGADHHGMWLDGGVISFTSIGQQHEGCRKNGIRIDNILEDGVVSSDLARTIKFQQNYITGCGSIDDHSPDSYGVYIANGDGIELDTPTFNLSRNGIGFDAQNVDNLLIRRPHFRTVSDYGKAQGFGIRSFSDGVPSKRQYLENPVFDQAHATQIDDKAREIFGRGAAGGRISFSTNTPTPSIIHGSGSGNESYHILNFNNTTATTITNITGGTPYQRLLITFSNGLC